LVLSITDETRPVIFLTISGVGVSGMEARANSEGDGEVPRLEGGECSALSFDDIIASGEDVPACSVPEDEFDDRESCKSLDRCNFLKVDVERRRMSLRNFMSRVGAKRQLMGRC
jgi:hypothetical protein